MSVPPKLRRLALAVAILVSGGCVRGKQPAGPALDPRALVGCYRFGTDQHIAFDSVPAEHRFSSPVAGSMRAWVYPDAAEDTYWRIIPKNTIEYVWDSGLYGYRIHFRARGDSLVGETYGWSDIAGRRKRPERTSAHREPCSTDGSPGTPPNSRELMRAIAPTVATVIADSLLPHLASRFPVSVQRAGYGFQSRDVEQLLRADPRVRPIGADTVFGTWISTQNFVVSRDSAHVEVIATLCDDRPGTNLQVDRAHYRFIRAGTRWLLATIEPISRSQGRCGNNLTK